jgi:hypothetical protein
VHLTPLDAGSPFGITDEHPLEAVEDRRAGARALPKASSA